MLDKQPLGEVLSFDENADFIATAREALPYWIDRAEKMEKAFEWAIEYLVEFTGK